MGSVGISFINRGKLRIISYIICTIRKVCNQRREDLGKGEKDSEYIGIQTQQEG